VRLKARLACVTMGLVLIATLAGFRAWSPFPGGGLFDVEAYRMTRHARIGHAVLARIPSDASLAAQDKLGPHLATRERIHLFPWFDRKNPPDMIILDTNDPNPYPLRSRELRASVRQLQMAPEVQTSWEQDGYFLFKMTSAPAFGRQRVWLWPPWLQLDGYELAQTDGRGAFVDLDGGPLRPGQTVRVGLYWTALASMGTNYSISLRLVAPDSRAAAQHDSWPGQGVFPTAVWPVGRTIRDIHYLHLPEGTLTGPLDLVVIVYETETAQPIPPTGGHLLTTLVIAS